MAKHFEDILNALPLDDKDRQLIEMSHDHEIEIIKNTQEIEKIKHTHEIEIIKNKHHYELELLKNDHRHEIDKLKTELSVANWENLKNLKLIELRSFIDKFDEKKLDKTITQRTERFAKFSKENKDLLKIWNLETELFKQVFQSLYGKLCGSAHPIFNTEDGLEIGASQLESREIRLMGILWEAFPLPLEKLTIRTFDKSENVSAKYKNRNIN